MKQPTIYPTVLYFLLILAMVIPSGCEKSITKPKIEPDPEVPDPIIGITFEPLLHASKLSVAIPRGWTEDITITALDQEAKPENFSATSGNTGIATVTQSNKTVRITGVNYGTTRVTLTSHSGKSRDIPVNIYNHRILETEELFITYSQEYERRYSRSDPNISFWHPLTTDGFKPVGSLAINTTSDPSGKQGIMVLKAKEGTDALAPPTGFTEILYMQQWDVNPKGTAWIPIAPDGYVALGVVVTRGRTPPSVHDVVTVRQDLTVPGLARSRIREVIDRDARYFGTRRPYRVWLIDPPHSSQPHENAYLPTGAFVYRRSGASTWPEVPSVHPVMHVLKVNLPMLTEPASHDEYRPRMTSYDRPPDETVPILARAMLVPSTILTDPSHSTKETILNSPFYRLERQIYYEVLLYSHNDTELAQRLSRTVTYGISQSESQEIWAETGIELSYAAGVSVKMVEAGYTATVSVTLGYSSATSITEFQETSYTADILIPPGKAGTLFHRYARFVLKRHNDRTKSLEVVRTWDVSNQDYHHAQYPPPD